MFQNSISGLDNLFYTYISSPKVVLITGPPGSLKTSFCFDVMTKFVENTDKFGMYTTLEETVESHKNNMGSFGIEKPSNVEITDVTDLREIDLLIEDEETDYVEFLEDLLRHNKKQRGDNFKIFTLDSLGALYSLMENISNMRKKMFYFFKLLSDLDLFSFVVMERSMGAEANLLGNEGFLVDGVINLSIDRSRGELTRFIQIEKMRACNHSMEKHAIEVGDGGLEVLGPIFE